MQLFKTFKEDFAASIVVFLVALPLCLGIALASGAPMMSGLVAGIAGGIVAGIISGARLGVSGPAAGLVVIVLGAIESIGFDAFLMAIIIAGFMQVAMGFARAGTLGNFFPSPVIKGMLTGIGVIIILKQLPHAFGFDAVLEGEMDFVQSDGSNTFSSLIQALGNLQPAAIFISFVALFILVFWEKVLAPRHKLFKVFPGALAAVLFGVFAHLIILGGFPGIALTPDHLVSIPLTDNPVELFNSLARPDFSLFFSQEVWFTALVIAVVASLETMLCVEAIDKLDPKRIKTPKNRELFAQGGANIVSGLFGGLPVTQVIVRSSANLQSGAQTKMSAIMHGILLLVLVLSIPKLLNLIPLSVLASVLILTGYKLAKPEMFMEMYRRGNEQFVPFMATMLGVVFTDLLMGIAIGMAIAILTLLYRNYANSHRMHVEHHEHEDGHLKTITLRLSEELSFLNKSAIIRELESIPDGSTVMLDASQCYVLDPDVAETLREFLNEAHERHIKVEVKTNDSPLVHQRLHPAHTNNG